MTKTLSWQQLQRKMRRQSHCKSINSSFTQIQNQFKPISTANFSDTPHPTMMIDILFWMCFSDALHSVQIIVC